MVKRSLLFIPPPVRKSYVNILHGGGGGGGDKELFLVIYCTRYRHYINVYHLARPTVLWRVYLGNAREFCHETFPPPIPGHVPRVILFGHLREYTRLELYEFVVSNFTPAPASSASLLFLRNSHTYCTASPIPGVDNPLINVEEQSFCRILNFLGYYFWHRVDLNFRAANFTICWFFGQISKCITYYIRERTNFKTRCNVHTDIAKSVRIFFIGLLIFYSILLNVVE